jgi:chromosome segregation ATPase
MSEEVSTYAVKLDSVVKQELQGLLEGYKEDTGATAGEFIKTLLEVYKTNKIVSRVSSTDADIKELNALTSRIYTIYSNLIERNNNGTNALQQEFSEQIKEKDLSIDALKTKLEELKENYDMLQSAFNDACKDKETIENRNAELQELNSSYKLNISKLNQELVSLQELKSINSKITNELNATKELLTKQQADNISLTDTIKHKDYSIDHLNETIENNKKEHMNTLDRLSKDHESNIQSLKDKLYLERDKAILELKQLHQQELEKLQNKYNADISKYNSEYKKVLEELEKSRQSHKRNNSLPKQSKQKTDI